MNWRRAVVGTKKGLRALKRMVTAGSMQRNFGGMSLSSSGKGRIARMANYTLQDVNALKERRKLSKITARELYETAGLTCTRYAAIEGGHDKPTNQEWAAIDRAFYAIDAKRAHDENKWLMTGSDAHTDTTRKLARWNAAVQGKDETS